MGSAQSLAPGPGRARTAPVGRDFGAPGKPKSPGAIGGLADADPRPAAVRAGLAESDGDRRGGVEDVHPVVAHLDGQRRAQVPRPAGQRHRPHGRTTSRLGRVETGLDAAQARRGPAVRPVALARGPGNLCSALAIEMGDNGVDVFDAASPVTVQLGEAGPDSRGPRVGVSQAADRPWRVLAHRAPRGLGLPAQSAGAQVRARATEPTPYGKINP